MLVELREGVKLAHDGVYALKCGDQACQRRRNPQDNQCTYRLIVVNLRAIIVRNPLAKS